MAASDEIAASILDHRSTVVKRLLSTEPGRELARLDAAYAALTGQPPPPWHATESTPSRSDPGDVAEASPAPPKPSKGPSVRQLVQDLLNEAPRTWTYDQIEKELADRGITVTVKNLREALRTATWALVRDGAARRSPDNGTIWSTVHVLRTPELAESSIPEVSP